MVSQPPPIEAVASLAQRLAVLLAAGVAPPAAWRYLDEASTDAIAGAHVRGSRSAAPRRLLVVGGGGGARDAGAAALTADVLKAAARAGSRGESIAEAIRAAVLGAGPQLSAPGVRAKKQAAEPMTQRSAQAWLALAAAWAVAHEAGAPLASTLRELAVTFRDQAQLERDLEVALSGPRATARMVGLMPAIGVLFGALMGFDTVNTLLFTVPGVACLVVGGALMFAGARWSNALVARAAAGRGSTGLLAQLTAIAMAGGASSERARTLAESALERYAASEAQGAHSADAAVIDGVLALSRRAGVPAAELLRSEAQQARLAARSDRQQRAAALAVTLMMPLGLCVLPAFMLLGVVPLLISVLASTLNVL